jgi:hypothetical protein
MSAIIAIESAVGAEVQIEGIRRHQNVLVSLAAAEPRR